MRSVMAAVGNRRAALFGYSEGGSMSALFSATHPQRVSHLILYGATARFTNCEDYAHMMPLETMLRSVKYWGTAPRPGPLRRAWPRTKKR